MKKIVTLFSATILMNFVATSCSTSANTAKLKPKAEVSISNQNWYLINDNDVVKGLYEKDVMLTIDEANSTVSGFAGCNNFNAAFTKVGGVTSFVNFSETKMACPNMQEEKAFLSMLKNVNRYEITGKELHLYKGNILLMKFKTI
ncbi:META domain-containing protein [Empedobacter brevis]|uniref:META domain-containing protein n=1 Tax=Empedobacter brevis TaxID=247 RepID=UPI001330983F|nr:META domain-containing protein [Empedobacter brevis]